MASLDVIPVFLASPGDLTAEREAATEVVEQVNRQLAGHFGLRLELYGWEYEAPGYGRAQARINANLEEAGLFIGMLWRRWGTASGDGHTSGFEEEWELACKRAESGEDVEVWLFFKEVDAAQKQDPGPELQKVLDFKNKVETEYQALYHPFVDAQAWREKLLTLLMDFVAKRARSQAGNEPDKSRPLAEVSAQETDEPEHGASGAVGQAACALDAMRRALESDSADQMSATQALRVLLAAFQWVSDTHTAETLDTHELNLFYKHRDELELTTAEELQLIRSMVTGNAVRAGWFWLRGEDGSGATETLMRLAAADRNQRVRQEAVKLLHDPQALEASEFSAPVVIKTLLGDGSSSVRSEVLSFAARSELPEVAELLRAVRGDSNPIPGALPALARILLRQAPDEALTLAAEEGILGRVLDDEYAAEAARFSDSAVANLWEVAPESRHLALRIEASRGAVVRAHADEAARSKATYGPFKALGVELCLENGWPVAEKDFDAVQSEFMLDKAVAHRRRVLRAAMLPDDELRLKALYYLAYSGAAFEALCVRQPDEMLAILREGLTDSLAAYRERSAEELRKKFGTHAERFIEEKKYQERDFLISALRGLALIGGADDASLVLPFLDASEQVVRTAALETLAELDPDQGAGAAKNIALTGPDVSGQRAHAAELALRLHPDFALELSKSDTNAVVRLAVPHLERTEDGLLRLTDLLNNKDDETREGAARRLIQLAEPELLSSLLVAYYAQESYYYNVVSLFDAAINAPEPYRSWYLDGTLPA
jgi:hypothetical protein